MQVTINSYNMLGKIGPHYERPEYRPPQPAPSDDDPAGRLKERGDRRTLSNRNTDIPPKTAAPAPAGKVTLDLARDLTRATAGLIDRLAPRSTTQEPHAWLPSRLMTPTYV